MIPFVRDFDFAYGRCDVLTPLIRRVVANNPGPFTFTGTGTYLIGHAGPGREVAVIDPGPRDDAHLAALLSAVRGQTVTHVFVTHAHLDHAPLARPFAEAVGAPILAAQPPAGLDDNAALDEGSDAQFQPDVTLTGGEVFEGDDWTLEALATPGHMSNHMAFVLGEERALFSGDHIMGWSTTIVAPPDGDMTDYMSSLDAVIRLAPQTIWPTHGPPITEPVPFLAGYRAHRLAREAQIIERLSTGDRRIGEMVPALYQAVDQRLWPAASLSMLAHLIALEKAGRVKAEPDAAMDADWRLL